jgi:hypothetical protein
MAAGLWEQQTDDPKLRRCTSCTHAPHAGWSTVCRVAAIVFLAPLSMLRGLLFARDHTSPGG